MKCRPDEPINTVLTQSSSLQNKTSLGLTKREHMAIEFTKALLTSPDLKTYKQCAAYGIEMADELIKQLNETQTHK